MARSSWGRFTRLRKGVGSFRAAVPRLASCLDSPAALEDKGGELASRASSSCNQAALFRIKAAPRPPDPHPAPVHGPIGSGADQ